MAKIMTLKTEKNTEKNTENRAILHITGKDAFAFLQGLITNDMAKTALNNNGGIMAGWSIPRCSPRRGNICLISLF